MPNVMAALPNIGGAVCESSVILFLVPCRKVWLTPFLECRAVTIGERKTWTQSEFLYVVKFRQGQELPKMYIVYAASRMEQISGMHS